MSSEEKVALAETTKDNFGLPAVLAALELPRSTWYYHQKYVKAYTEKYAHLREPLETTIGAPRKNSRRYAVIKPTTK